MGSNGSSRHGTREWIVPPSSIIFNGICTQFFLFVSGDVVLYALFRHSNFDDCVESICKKTKMLLCQNHAPIYVHCLQWPRRYEQMYHTISTCAAVDRPVLNTREYFGVISRRWYRFIISIPFSRTQAPDDHIYSIKCLLVTLRRIHPLVCSIWVCSLTRMIIPIIEIQGFHGHLNFVTSTLMSVKEDSILKRGPGN